MKLSRSDRPSLSAAQRVRIFDHHKGVCHLCGLVVKAGEKWHVEHVIPRWQGGPDSIDNMQPAHDDCHAPKTAAEARQRAKEARIRAKHLGCETKPRKKLQGRGFTPAPPQRSATRPIEKVFRRPHARTLQEP